MTLRLQSVSINTGSPDSESLLVFDDNFLVAVLTHLSGDHEEAAGMWFLEAGFGPVDDPCPPSFADLDAAQTWIRQQLARVP